MGSIGGSGQDNRHDGLDPVTASASSLAHGRIGLVAWALFESGDGLVLSFEKLGRFFTVEVHSGAEKAAFEIFRKDLAALGGEQAGACPVLLDPLGN